MITRTHLPAALPATCQVLARAEGSASAEAHPSEESRRADERGPQ